MGRAYYKWDDNRLYLYVPASRTCADLTSMLSCLSISGGWHHAGLYYRWQMSSTRDTFILTSLKTRLKDYGLELEEYAGQADVKLWL